MEMEKFRDTVLWALISSKIRRRIDYFFLSNLVLWSYGFSGKFSVISFYGLFLVNFNLLTNFVNLSRYIFILTTTNSKIYLYVEYSPTSSLGIHLRKNQGWEFAHLLFPSNQMRQMNDLSNSLRSLKTNERPWAIRSGRSEEMSKWAIRSKNVVQTNLKSCF